MRLIRSPLAASIITRRSTQRELWSQNSLIRYGGWGRLPAWHFLNVLTASLGLVMLFISACMFNESSGFSVIFMVSFHALLPRTIMPKTFLSWFSPCSRCFACAWE